MNESSQTDEKTDYAAHALSWESSKLGQAAYCAQHGLDYSRLITARSKLLLTRGTTGQQKKSVKFIPVRAKQGAHEVGLSQPSCIIIRLAKGGKVELPVHLGAQQLSAIFKALS